jgi:hypothetical protein
MVQEEPLYIDDLRVNQYVFSIGIPREWRGFAGIVLKVNLQDEDALENLDEWLLTFDRYASDKKIVVIGTTPGSGSRQVTDEQIKDKLKSHKNISYVPPESGHDITEVLKKGFASQIQLQQSTLERAEDIKKNIAKDKSLFQEKLILVRQNIIDRKKYETLADIEKERLNTLLAHIEGALDSPHPQIYWDVAVKSQIGLDKEIQFIELRHKLKDIKANQETLPLELKTKFSKIKTEIESFLSISTHCEKSEDLPSPESYFAVSVKQWLNDVCEFLHLGRPFSIILSTETLNEINTGVPAAADPLSGEDRPVSFRK